MFEGVYKYTEKIQGLNSTSVPNGVLLLPQFYSRLQKSRLKEGTAKESYNIHDNLTCQEGASLWDMSIRIL